MGYLEIAGGADNLMNADLTYETPEWKPVVEHSLSDHNSSACLARLGLALLYVLAGISSVLVANH